VKQTHSIESSSFENKKKFEVFWDQFSQAVLQRDTLTITHLIAFPFRDFYLDIYNPQESLTSNDFNEFMRKYDLIFDPFVVTAIKNKKIRGFDPHYSESGDIIDSTDYLLLTQSKVRAKDLLFKLQPDMTYKLIGIQYYE
jgi:hypothetical protein